MAKVGRWLCSYNLSERKLPTYEQTFEGISQQFVTSEVHLNTSIDCFHCLLSLELVYPHERRWVKLCYCDGRKMKYYWLQYICNCRMSVYSVCYNWLIILTLKHNCTLIGQLVKHCVLISRGKLVFCHFRKMTLCLSLAVWPVWLFGHYFMSYLSHFHQNLVCNERH